MTSPPTRATRGSSESRSPSNARIPSRTAPRACMANPTTEGRPIPQMLLLRASFRTLTFGSVCQAGTPPSLFSHAYSASHLAGVILTYITIITI